MFLLLYFIIQTFTKENAVIVILCRNEEMNQISESIKNFEEMFNKQYNYPYVFLNDNEFTEEFKSRIKGITGSSVEFGKINYPMWGPPKHINMDKAKENMKTLESQNIIYGGSLSYRNMCRFFSGYFYRHDLVKKYDYYWRIEPGVKFFCKMNYDPFKFLKESKKEYGFVITIREYMQTIPTLWDATKEFLSLHRNIINIPVLDFIFNDDLSYNGCHFWSNFEIASFSFFRSEIYQKYFDFLDLKGGFYYERWGDAPIHSLAANLFLGKDKIHFFEDIGYEHPPYQHCPKSPSRLIECTCTPNNSIDMAQYSCLKEYLVSYLK